MLRITTLNEDAQTVTLKAEGRIVSDWAATLARECDRWLASGKAINLDCSQVTFIDTRGVSVIRTLLNNNVRITRCPALIKSLIHEEHTP